MNEKKCKVLAAEIRLETLKVIHSRGFGHVGGSMDLADLMAVLYGEVMKFDPKNPRWEDRDWLVLSKGHAGPVAYATFGLMGYYPMEEAYTLNHPHTKFPSHTDRKLTPTRSRDRGRVRSSRSRLLQVPGSVPVPQVTSRSSPSAEAAVGERAWSPRGLSMGSAVKSGTWDVATTARRLPADG